MRPSKILKRDEMTTEESPITPENSLETECEDKEDDMGRIEATTGNEDQPASWNPLLMNEILHIVLGLSDIPTLKTARLVCKLWNLEAIPKLYQKAYFTVPPNFYEQTKKKRKSEIAHMKNFLSRHHIMLPKIRVLLRRDVSTLNDFGQPGENPCIGPFVRQLLYGAHDSPEYLTDLLDRMENLQVLDTRLAVMDEESVPGKFCPAVIKMCAQLSPRVITLTYLFVDDPQFVKELKSLSNVKVQWFQLCILPCVDYIPDIRVRLSESLSNILEENKDNMVALSVVSAETYLAETRVPTMSQLQRFSCTVFAPCHCHDIFIPPKYELPPDFQFSVNFPSMSEMDLGYDASCIQEDDDDDDFYFWMSYFANQNPAPSLKKLNYSAQGHDCDLDPILKCFSHLEELEVSNPGDLSMAAESIFTLGQNLKTLKLDINLEILISTTSSFDEVFTGFSQKLVHKIRHRPKDWDVKEVLEEGKTLDDLRVEPSLLDLPHLESLSITFSGNFSTHLPRKMLYVAAKCAFSLLPKLQVVIHTEEARCKERLKIVLKEVSEFPNVTVV